MHSKVLKIILLAYRCEQNERTSALSICKNYYCFSPLDDVNHVILEVVWSLIQLMLFWIKWDHFSNIRFFFPIQQINLYKNHTISEMAKWLKSVWLYLY